MPTPTPRYGTPMEIARTPSADVLAAFFTGEATLTPIDAGHINDTFAVAHRGERYVIQRLSPIFSPSVNEDIAALVPHLERAGLRTPTLVRSKSGGLWHVADDGGVWRVLTFIHGRTFVTADGPPMAWAAGDFLARFHRAFDDVQYTFVAARLGVHDTPAHLTGLTAAIATHADHDAHAQVGRQAELVFAMLDALEPMPCQATRIVHGDPKLSNFLFADPHTVAALVDLDTLSDMEIALELGDALRSWSNSGPGGGEAQAPRFALPLFAAAVQGYAHGAHGRLQGAEIAQIADATLRISLELTARFLRDALEERYFSWDRSRFARAFEHHLQRADAQLSFARSLHAQLNAARDAVATAFAPPTGSGGHAPMPRAAAPR